MMDVCSGMHVFVKMHPLYFVFLEVLSILTAFVQVKVRPDRHAEDDDRDDDGDDGGRIKGFRTYPSLPPHRLILG